LEVIPITEQQHQQSLFKWSQQPHIRAQYPCLKLLHHIPNERQCSPAMGRQLKLAGVRAGICDLHLPVARGGYHSLYIEMKNETGRTSPEQEWWVDNLLAEGNFAEVCHGHQSAIRVIEWYLSLPAK
jgi:hypothetical protein